MRVCKGLPLLHQQHVQRDDLKLKKIKFFFGSELPEKKIKATEEEIKTPGTQKMLKKKPDF